MSPHCFVVVMMHAKLRAQGHEHLLARCGGAVVLISLGTLLWFRAERLERGHGRGLDPRKGDPPELPESTCNTGFSFALSRR